MAIQLPIVSTYQVADVNASANSLVLRDGSGNVNGAAVSGSALITTGALVLQRVAKSAAFTADANGTLYACDATAAAFAATLPPAASVAGRVYWFKKVDASANAVTVTANGAETIDGSNTKALSS